MSDRSFDFQMAGSAKSNQVSCIVRSISEQECSSTVNVMNIQRSAFAQSATEAANFVAIEHGKPDTAPMCSKLEIASAAPIRVSGPDCRALCAFMGAKLSAALLFTGESAVRFFAVVARQLQCCYQTSVAALKGTMPNGRVPFLIEHCTAYFARDIRLGVLASIFDMACRATKLEFCFFLYDVARALEFIFTIGADKRWPVGHGRRMASLTAENRSRVVGLKIIPTMGACLDH